MNVQFALEQVSSLRGIRTCGCLLKISANNAGGTLPSRE
jgi:hypothetical protein